MYALRDYSDSVSPYECSKFCDFSSETKWSGGTFENGKTYIVGATECILKSREKYSEVYSEIEKINQTVRILVLAESDSEPDKDSLPDDLKHDFRDLSAHGDEIHDLYLPVYDSPGHRLCVVFEEI